jgi:hypothetical protein
MNAQFLLKECNSMSYSDRFFAVTARSLLVVLALMLSGTAIAAKIQNPPQTTKDGLNLVTSTKTRFVYMADDVDLTQYTKVSILDAYVAFEKTGSTTTTGTRFGLDNKVSDKSATRIKDELAAEFKKIFTEEMQKNNHEVVDTTGSDVLILRPAIIKLVVTAPDLQKIKRSRSFTGDPGAMTLYLELYDSVSSAKLVEIIDARDLGHAGGNMMYSNKATNKFAADRVLRDWADKRAGHLGEVQASADIGNTGADADADDDAEADTDSECGS